MEYTDEKFDRVYTTAQAARRGTELHKLAYDLIRLRERLPEKQRTINMYVNDGIGFRMTPEVTLWYSDHLYSFADTIAFSNGKLRVHDLKTGVGIRKSERQLFILMALFCLEYNYKPYEIEMEGRIYQNNAIKIFIPGPEVIAPIIDRAMHFNNRIEQRKREEML